MKKIILFIVLITHTTLLPCRLWGVKSLDDFLISYDDGIGFVQSEADFFEQLSIHYLDGWSLCYYEGNNNLGNIHRSDTIVGVDTSFSVFINEVLDYENDAKTLIGHLRSSSSGATDIENPHPFLFEYNGLTYSFIHNGSISKSILINLLTENNTDSTWINENPPNTFGESLWYSEIGWQRVIDSELFMLWIMKNIIFGEADEIENIMVALEILENAQSNADKNFILSNGEVLYAYASESNSMPDLFYSDSSSVLIADVNYDPHFVSVMSEVPQSGPASLLNWNQMNNESLLVIDNNLGYYVLENFINHTPRFVSDGLNDTLDIYGNYSYMIQISDEDNDPLDIFLEDNPSWVSIDNNQLILSPDTLGIFSFRIIGSDGQLNDYLECTINVVGYSPVILEISDVPNDNGGWVFVKFVKSFWDQSDSRNIEFYHIERQNIDEWISVGSSAAYGSENYMIQVPTEGDSSTTDDGITNFRVIASMNEGLWISSVESGYSINNNSLNMFESNTLPNDYFIHQNFPNPFNSSTLIKYDLPKKSRISIILYDLMGKKIKTLVDEVQDPGFKTIEWNGLGDNRAHQASGLYFCRIKSLEFEDTIKLILSK